MASNPSTRPSVYLTSFASFRKRYLSYDIKLSRPEKVSVAFLTFALAGFIGWLYEVLVACLEHGHLVLRGENFLPWMNIYAFGALIIIPVVYRFRRSPLKLLFFSALLTGGIELIAGWALDALGGGQRFWNYNHGIWLIGSINGYVCFLSVAIFTLFSLLLIYFLLPYIIYLSKTSHPRTFLILATLVFSLVLADELLNLTLRTLDLPRAKTFYTSLGLEYADG